MTIDDEIRHKLALTFRIKTFVCNNLKLTMNDYHRIFKINIWVKDEYDKSASLAKVDRIIKNMSDNFLCNGLILRDEEPL